mgnify:CR=1 FL=1
MKNAILVALMLCLVTGQAWAAGCDCGSVSAIVARASTQTIQAVNANTTAEAAAIRSEILLAAQNIIGTIKSESATIVRAIIGLKESNAAIIKGQAVAGEAMRTEDLYGKAAQPSGLCGASSLGAGVQLSAQAARQVHQTMRSKQLEYSNKPGSKPVEFLERILDDAHPTEKEIVDSFFLCKCTNLWTFSVIAQIDMYLTFIRIIHIQTAIDRLVKQFLWFIVGSDKYIYFWVSI